MKIRIIILAVILCGSVAAQTTPELGIRDKTPEITALTNARIIPAPGRVIENGTLLIRDGIIVAVGAGIAIPDDARVVDVEEKTIYPAFIDPYTEYGVGDKSSKKSRSWRDGPKYLADRAGGDSWNDAIHAELNWTDTFKPDKSSAEDWIKLGFATVQSARFDGIFRGRSFVTTLEEGLANDVVLRPYSSQFASFNKGKSKQSYPNSLMGSIALIRQSFLDASWYSKAQTAYKADPSQVMPEFNRSIAALAENGKRPIVFETGDELTLLRAARLSHEFGIPFYYIGANDEYARLEEIRALKRPLILPVNYPKAPEVKTLEDELDVDLSELRHWERAPSNPATLEAAGVRFAFTTFRLKKKESFLKNVRTAVKRGLSVETALAALTTVPAEICGVGELVGTLEKGKLASFIVAEDSLLQKEATIYSVWVAGSKHEFKPLKQDDFRGTYRLSLLNFSWDLIIEEDTSTNSENKQVKGDIEKVSGKIAGPEDTVKIEVIEQTPNKLHFSARLEKLGLPGVTRFSGRKKGDDLKGRCTLSDAEDIDWFAEFIRAFTPEDESPEPGDEAPDTVISRLTYPNMAFGYEQSPAQQDVLIKNATIWTCEDDGILKNSDMLIRGGKIAQVGTNLKAPKGVLVIDATGKHLSPGIIDEHSHIAISRGVNEGSHAVTAEVRIGDVVNSDHIAIYRALAGGVTMAHLLHGSANPIGGQAQMIKLRWGATPEKMKYDGIEPTIKFALGENVKQSNWGDNYNTRYPQSRMGVETIVKDAFQAAREYETAWEKYSALRGGSKKRTVPPRRDLQLETLLEIMNSKRFIHCHSYHQTEILMLMRVAEEFGFHIQTFTHILEGYKVAGEMADHGAMASTFADWWAYKFEVYDAIPYNTCIMHEKGVITSINSDSQELMRRLNLEAAKSVQYCGMSQEEALKLATLNPAKQLRIDDRVGSIKVGKDADFVLWSGNPLSIYSHPEQTWIDGARYFDLETDARLREDNRAERRALIQKVLESGEEGDGDISRKHKKKKEWRCDDIIDVWQILNR